MKPIRPFDPKKTPRPNFDLAIDGDSFRKLRSLDIEIGCGVGLHPIRYCQANKDRNLVAIEQTKTKYEKFIKRLERHPVLHNLFPIQADAINWISHFVSSHQVDRYFLLYPNPYPKASQKNLRWANRPFMKFLIETLKPDGHIVFRTNLADYAEETKETLTSYWKLNLASEFTISSSSVPWTHFEKKYLLRGQKCFHLEFSKNS